MRKQKILVTGGSGYIGSHTVVELIAAGFDVVIADSLVNSNREVLDGINQISKANVAFVEMDFCHEASVENLFQLHPDFDAIIHFAAFKAVGESVEKPLLYYRNNLFSLVNLLEKCNKYKIGNIIFSSSCTVYGNPDSLPVSENAAIKLAESPYGNTKQIGEEILRDSVKAHSLQVISLRYFNPIGAHETSLIGELPLGVPNNLVPFITQTAIGLREKVTVFGNDYETIDGSCVRDYIHVVDIAKAHVIACQRLIAKKNKENYEVFNLGTGRGNSVLEVIKTFEKVSGMQLNYTIGARRSGDVEQVYADTKLANNELGWVAERDLENMLSTSWAWEKSISTNK